MFGGTEHDICHSIQNQWYLQCNFSRKDFGFKIRLFSSCDKNIYINTRFYQDLFFNITCKLLIICHLFTIIFELIISLFSVWSRDPYVQFGSPPSLDPHLIFSHNKGYVKKNQTNQTNETKQKNPPKLMKKQTHISRHIIVIVLIFSIWRALLILPNTKSSYYLYVLFFCKAFLSFEV